MSATQLLNLRVDEGAPLQVLIRPCVDAVFVAVTDMGKVGTVVRVFRHPVGPGDDTYDVRTVLGKRSDSEGGDIGAETLLARQLQAALAHGDKRSVILSVALERELTVAMMRVLLEEITLRLNAAAGVESAAGLS
eukprot:a848213_24.p1 GENE.a848213_24~~a848213_24.p1  ORF type:complete len:144 (-),score=41.97 a848213_24:21-425(-)